MNEAMRHGFTAEAAVAELIRLSLLHGADFLAQPWARKVLTSPEVLARAERGKVLALVLAAPPR